MICAICALVLSNFMMQVEDHVNQKQDFIFFKVKLNLSEHKMMPLSIWTSSVGVCEYGSGVWKLRVSASVGAKFLLKYFIMKNESLKNLYSWVVQLVSSLRTYLEKGW